MLLLALPAAVPAQDHSTTNNDPGIPSITELQEIPAQYCGTYYSHEIIGVGRRPERVSPAKPFGKIEAKQITLAGRDLLKITRISQTLVPNRFVGFPQPSLAPLLMITFEKSDFGLSIMEISKTMLGIMQFPQPLDFKKLSGELIIVSQNKDQPPDDIFGEGPRKIVNLSPPDAYQAVIRDHSDVAGLPYLELFDDSWRQHDLAGFRVQTEERQDLPVMLLTRAVYLLLVQSDDDETQKKLAAADRISGLHYLPSYAAFKQALKDAGALVPQGQDRKARAQFLFETYKDDFPLRSSIKKVGEDFQAAYIQRVDSAPPPKIQVFVECRGNEVFCVNRNELEGQFAKLLSDQKGPLDDATVKALAGKEVGDSIYTIDIPQLLQRMKMCLRPKPGVHGEGLVELDHPTGRFRQLLHDFAGTGTTITFLVRPDSHKAFQKAQRLAESNGFNTNSKTLGSDALIVISSQAQDCEAIK